MKRVLFNTLLISCAVLAACKKKTPPVNTEVPVNLMKVKEQKVLYYDKIPATVQAFSQDNILPQVTGAITGIFFKDGEQVHKGQKLYEIDKRIYQANYDQAVANLKVAEGNKTQSDQDKDRYDYLNKYNAVAKQTYDHAVITAQNADNSVRAALEAVKSAKTSLTYSTVYAPFDGTIGFSQVKLGTVVQPGTILNTISTDNPMAVDFVVNEKILPKYERLQYVKDQVKDSLFTFQLPDNTIYTETGSIANIDRAVDPQTGTIRIRLKFPNNKHFLRVGMSGNVRVHNQDTEPQMVLPNKAVVEQMGEYFVFVALDTMVNNPKMGADSAKKKMKSLLAHQKKIQIGQVIGPNIVVKSGIQPGDRIITDGLQTLHDGSKITTKNVVGPGGGGRGGK
jgi:membrane fusion protein (multidrug efflux system)